MTFNYILFRDKWLNRNCKYDYRIIFIDILLLLVKQLGKIAAVS